MSNPNGQDIPGAPDTPETWGAASQGYADKVAPVMMGSFMSEFVDRLAVHSTSKVLEVGAGSGILTEVLALRGHSVLATDFAPKMIEVLRKRMQAAGLGNVTCEVMDGQNLKVDDNSFDAVASSFAVMFFPDRVKGFSEFCRVLRSDGRAMVSGWAGPDRFQAFGLFLEAMKTGFPDMPPPPTPPPVLSLADPTDFKVQMEAGGFRDVEVGFVTRDLQVPGFSEMWEMLTVGAPPVQMLFNRVGPAGRDRLHDTLAKIVEERYGSGPIVISNTATCGTGTAP